jgi:hypothetical protein
VAGIQQLFSRSAIKQENPHLGKQAFSHGMPLPNDEKTPKTTPQKQKSAFAFPKKAAAPPKAAQKNSALAPTCLPTYRLPVAVSFFGCPLYSAAFLYMYM